MHKYAIDIIGRSHDQLVKPSWFGDKKTKDTCWWLDGLPPLQKTNKAGHRNTLSGLSATMHHLDPIGRNCDQPFIQDYPMRLRPNGVQS